MRIIGGELGGRRFNPPAKNWPTRPTTDQSKESLYNILANRVDFDTMVMLDLFGGTGSHCYECVSRGCRDATCVDAFAPAIKYVKETSKELKIDQFIQVIKADVVKFIQSHQRNYSFIFADPPYDWVKVRELPDILFSSNILAEGGLFVLEHEQKHDFSKHERYTDSRKYGATVLSFFE